LSKVADEAAGDLKVCRDCGILKPVGDFWRRKQSADGLALYCKSCFGKRNAASYRGQQKKVGKAPRPHRPWSDVPEGMKFCPRCQDVKSRAESGRNRAAKDGLTNYCRPCHTLVIRTVKVKNHGSERNYRLKHRYGITEAEADRMHAEQGGLCREAWGETTDEEEIARLAAAEDEAWRGLLEAVS
jgi:hypothetical protein